jgi:retinol dehydrogenase-12
MRQNVYIVSGATDGIGRVTALELAKTGGAVILIGRDRAKAERVAERIRRATGNERVDFELADLSSQAEIRSLAERRIARPEAPDVLVNNVGAGFQRRRVSIDGIEMTFALNHLGYFLLTGLLLQRLKERPAARIVNVSSMAHRGPQIDFADPQGAARYSGWRAYQASKLANILFTYHLAEKLDGSTVTANCLHPGFVASKFGHNNGALFKWGIVVAQQIAAISEKRGAETSVHLAASPAVEGVSGKYFDKCRPIESSPQSHDSEARARLWKLSEDLTGFSY